VFYFIKNNKQREGVVGETVGFPTKIEIFLPVIYDFTKTIYKMTNYEEETNNEETDNEETDNEETDNEETDNDNEMTDDQVKSELIATDERLFDTNYYETMEQDNTYYITVPYRINENYLKDLHISSRGFFNHSLQTVQNYICEYTVSALIDYSTPVEIVKTSYIQLSGGFTMYNIIIKTFWLKIVQRRWRNVLKKRKEIIQGIRESIRNREYRNERFQIPQLRGCLADIKGTKVFR
jgi:hypothetical protein